MPLNEWLSSRIGGLDSVDAIISTTVKRKQEVMALLRDIKPSLITVVDIVKLSFINTIIPSWALDEIPACAKVSYNAPQGLLLSHDPPEGRPAPCVPCGIDRPLYQSPVEMKHIMSTPFSFTDEPPPIMIPSNRIMKKMRGSTYLTGKGVRIAVIDTGFTTVPSQWEGRTPPEMKSAFPSPPLDYMGHGTDVANTACGSVANSPYGYVGGMAPGADLISIKALNIACVGRNIDIIRALSMALRAGARVINMSLGSFLQGSVLDDPLCQAVDDTVFNGGVTVVAAAGNNGTEWSIRAPAAALGAIAVGSTSWTDKSERSWFSAMGPQSTWYKEHPGEYQDHLSRFGGDGGFVKPDVMAYGGGRASELEEKDEFIVNGSIGWGELLHDGIPDMFGAWHGSSQAAPVVTGMIALALEKDHRLTSGRVRELCCMGPKNAEYGTGLLTLGRLL